MKVQFECLYSGAHASTRVLKQFTSEYQLPDNVMHTVSEGEQGIDLQESPPELEGRSMYGA